MNAATLYNTSILRLATGLPHDDRLAEPDGSATHRAPICGSEMSAEVMVKDGVITAAAFRARACALGQASAALLRDHAVGLGSADIIAARAILNEYLSGGDGVALPWEELAHFAAARSHPARHGAILLPYEALIAAIEDAD